MVAFESLGIWSGILCYVGGFAASLCGQSLQARAERFMLWSVSIGALMLALVIAERWQRVGYGPFLTLFEILLSNLASLGILLGVIFWRFPGTRPAAPLALAVLLLLAVWILFAPADPGSLPATYDTWLLWAHVGVGKVFLACSLLAAALAGRMLWRWGSGSVTERDIANSESLIWRLLAAAFVFDSLMLIAGAVWAQDAWGRYWAWDPLETSAFLNWLLLAITLHARATWRLPLWAGWLLATAVFIVAFLTFFGLPFLSAGPHQGML